MKPVHIAKCAMVTALGDSLEQLWQALMQSHTGIIPVERFNTDYYMSRNAAMVPALHAEGKESLMYALLERLFTQFDGIPRNAKLITATTKAGIDSFEKLRRGLPANPADLSPITFGSAISRRFNLQHSPTNINAACVSSSLAIARGAALISQDLASSVLVCCMDLVSEFVFSGFSSLQAMSSEQCRPFDKNRSGLSLGEGAVAMLLMSPEALKHQGCQSIGQICGWGIANDANHVTAPARDGCGLVAAIHKALEKAGVGSENVAGISAHGTGTVYNDQMELTAFQEVFHGHRIPIHSVKGAIGHTLGAAGGIEVILGTRMLKERTMPPTVGLQTPEVGAEMLVKAHSQNLADGYLLSTNSGFGGINTAVLISEGTVQ